MDLSESRLSESRCFGTLDDMNNWAGPKFLIAEGDTYQIYPDDETYPQLLVNYVKLDRLPNAGEDWSSILRAMRAGDFSITSGEVLIRHFALEGSGNRRAAVVDPLVALRDEQGAGEGGPKSERGRQFMTRNTKFLMIAIVLCVVAFVVCCGAGLFWGKLGALHGSHG